MASSRILTLLVLFALAAVSLAAPPAAAGTGATTAAGAGCALVDSDACTQPWTADGSYNLVLSGRYTGTATIRVVSATNPIHLIEFTCSGELIGVVSIGSCVTTGSPPTGPVLVKCSSSGTGALACAAHKL